MERKSKNPLYNFLMNPKFGKWRRFAFVILMLLISLREVIFSFQSGLAELKGGSLLLITIYFLINLYPAQLILGSRLTNCLHEKRYLHFVISSSAIIVSTIIVKIAIEYFLQIKFNLHTSLENGITLYTLWDWTNKFATTLTCIYGVSSIFLLKNWIKEKKKIQKVETEQLMSELESLKEQVDSSLLLDTLKGTSEMATTDPEMASQRIRLLSAVLRYELYDCKRDKVFLSSEISFINNVLKLWTFQLPHLKYTVSTEGNVQGLLIPPLLIISLIQIILRKFDTNDKSEHCIDICISCNGREVCFVCKHKQLKERVMPTIDILRRLRILFGDKWQINCDLTQTEFKFERI